MRVIDPKSHDWTARETTVGMKFEATPYRWRRGPAMSDLDREHLMPRLRPFTCQVIPHAFGRNRPPVINTADMLRTKV